MKKPASLTRITLFLVTITLTSSCQSMRRALAGFSGPVYATDADFAIKRVRATEIDPDTTFILSGGSKYRVVDIVAGTSFMKMIPIMAYKKGDDINNSRIVIRPDTLLPGYHTIKSSNELFSVAEADVKPHNRILVNQIALGTMLLPIKIRRPVDHNGVRYERQFSTDISIGPYIGYRFKFKRDNYKTFTTIGLFAGPTLINYVSTVDQTGSPTNGANPDNMFAFTYGLGLVHEINGFQIGAVYGTDKVSGKRVEEWPYDGKGWFSVAIGYNFLAGRAAQ